MTANRPFKKIGEFYRLADQRVLHKINIPDEAGKQRTQSQEYRGAVGAQSLAASHGVSHKRRPKAHQDS